MGKVSAQYAGSTTRTTIRTQQQSLTGEWYTTEATAITRTDLARQLAPRRQPALYLLPAAAAAILTVMLLCSVGLMANDPGGLTPTGALGVVMVLLIMAGLLAGAIALTVVLWRRHQAQLPDFHRRLRHWQSQFYCARCDMTFVPAARRLPTAD
ncbi:hypothetical protein [Dactylosporangium sp. CA-233914]|uniref:hypothetical protein n=1 Tax=Dactylosporangium sp. CA-233914 TaxID=3239934 RepID=UPI003D8A151D